MNVTCARCSRVIEYRGDPPSFCGYCGSPLRSSSLDETAAYKSPAPTIAHLPPGADETDPERVAGYRLIRALGKGGMGTVYEAEDSGFGRKVALKLIAPGFLESDEAVERFRQEGRLASTIAHPRCVFVLGADEEAGRPYIVMELMPGTTLQSVVDDRGPMASEEAVAKIIDVIDGLREAHRVGVIHRDVKPSNCFLEAEGRVKIGDFGLSKSLGKDRNLTRTGSFLGTPLYASPEQIRGEELDSRTDVYSAAATLYFLLTGRAPHDHKDAAATMARIVSDPAPSVRATRPELSAELDRVVRKGLERDRDRRWRDVDEMAEALRPFLPSALPTATTMLRTGAYVIDYVILFLCYLLNGAFLESWLGLRPAVAIGLDFAVWMGYFTLSESRWGSPGKLLLRLRVKRVDGREPAGVVRALVRSVVFFVLVEMPSEMLFYPNDFSPLGTTELGVAQWIALWFFVLFLGITVMAAPMLWGGKRGLHELLSRTRVVSLPHVSRRRGPEERRRVGRALRSTMARPVGVLQSFGPYHVRGAIRWEPGRKVLSAEDSSLGREAWIVLRPRSSPPPSAARRELTRPTRPRWLSGGDRPEGHWDAYAAPLGCPLADLAGPEGLPWRDARPILEDLAHEFEAACADGTLPDGLTVDQVWVEPDGRVLLVDTLEPEPAEPPAPESPTSREERALALLRSAAVLALEGGRRRREGPATAVRAAVPLHASQMLRKLLGGPDAYRDIRSFRADLAATADRPREVSRAHRSAHMAAQLAFLSPGLLWIFFLTAYAVSADVRLAVDMTLDRSAAAPGRGPAPRDFLLLAGLFPALWVAWAFFTRGGLSWHLVGLGLVQSNGLPASRWRHAWRTLVMWVPMTALLGAAAWASYHGVRPASVPWVLLVLGAVSVAWYMPLAIWNPQRGPQDRLAGTFVVPR